MFMFPLTNLAGKGLSLSPIGKPQESLLDRLTFCRLLNGSQLVVRIFTTESLPRHLFTVNRPLGEANPWISE